MFPAPRRVASWNHGPVTADPQHSPRLRIAVVGAGTIGCHLGGHLAHVADVTLIGRERVLGPLRAEGLRLTGGSSPTRDVPSSALALTTTPAAVEGADLVLLTTKSRATETAVAEIAPFLGAKTSIISIQNGLANPERIRASLARAGRPDAAQRVVAGMISYNVVHAAPTHFHAATAGEVFLAATAAAESLATAARAAGLRVSLRNDMSAVQHAKLLMNLNNAINALSGRPLKEELGTRDYRRCLALCQDEALDAFAAAGARTARLTPLPTRATPAVLRSPNLVFAAVAARTLRIDPEARSSMAEDFDLGRATEIDDLQGAVSALGRVHDVPTPVCDRVVELVRDAETAGPARHRWEAEELLATLDRARGRGSTR